jgi:hypothetical protein
MAKIIDQKIADAIRKQDFKLYQQIRYGGKEIIGDGEEVFFITKTLPG